MRRFCIALGLSLIAFCSFALARPLRVAAQARQPATDNPFQVTPFSPVFYTTRVRPILEANCARCHLNGNHRGGLNMDTRAAMLKGGRDGSVLVPGDPQRSLLVALIRHQGPADDPMPMPPNKPRLSDADIDVVAQWVRAGAVTGAP